MNRIGDHLFCKFLLPHTIFHHVLHSSSIAICKKIFCKHSIENISSSVLLNVLPCRIFTGDVLIVELTTEQ